MTKKTFTKKQINFLREEYTHTTITREDLAKKFNKKFGENVAKTVIRDVLSKYKILKDKQYHKKWKALPLIYNDTRLKFLSQNYERTDFTKKELTQLFNKKFNMNQTVSAIESALREYCIKKIKKYREIVAKKYPREVQFLYKKKHIDFIRKNYTEKEGALKTEFLPLFNEKFGLNLNFSKLGYLIHRYKLRKHDKGRGTIYTPKVKQFIRKCVEEEMTKQECKEACEKEFARHFVRESVGMVASRMGLRFRCYPKTETDIFFEERSKEIVELIKNIKKKNLKDSYQALLVRDKIICEYQINVRVLDILIFCEKRHIKIRCPGQSLEERRAGAKESQQIQRNRQAVAERSEVEDNEYY